MRAVVVPLGSDVFVLGRVDGVEVDVAAETLNIASAEWSEEFVASRNTESEQRLAVVLGTRLERFMAGLLR